MGANTYERAKEELDRGKYGTEMQAKIQTFDNPIESLATIQNCPTLRQEAWDVIVVSTTPNNQSLNVGCSWGSSVTLG